MYLSLNMEIRVNFRTGTGRICYRHYVKYQKSLSNIHNTSFAKALCIMLNVEKAI